MLVEAATTINQLVATNPLHTDGLDEADSHLRLLKATLQTTFPNITGAVTASHTDLNNVTGLISTAGGLLKIPAPSPAVGTTGGQILLNGASGQTDILLTNAAGSLTFFVGNAAGGTSTSWTVLSSLSTAGALSLTGAVGATSVLKGGNELLPIGTILMWSGSIATVPAGWHLCDGTNGTPNLSGRFILHADGSAFAPTQTGGAGAVTATTSTIAGHSHGGLTGAAGGATPSGVTD